MLQTDSSDRAMKEHLGPRLRLPGVVYPPLPVLQHYVSAGVLTDETLAGGFRTSFQRNASRVAIAGPEGTWTYRQLDEASDRFAAALIANGIQQHDRAIFQLANCAELIVGVVGCIKAGVIPVCTLATHREQEIGYLAKHSRATLYIAQGDDQKFDLVGFAQRQIKNLPDIKLLISARGEKREGVPTLDELVSAYTIETASEVLGRVELDPFQVAVFQLSGGTTGVPKIIPRFGNEYLYNMRCVINHLDYRPDDVFFMPTPMMHNANMVCGWGPMLLTGAKAIVAPEMNPSVAARALIEEKATWVMIPKPLLDKLRHHPNYINMDLSHVRGAFGMNGSSVLRAMFGIPGNHIYGMSEGVIMFTRSSDPQEARDISVGTPVSEHDDVRILRPGTEDECLDNEVGELVAKGPYTFHGYYDAAERNAECFTREGYYRSGDLMSRRRIDGKAYYVFEGRLKDVVDRGGEKVNCEEIERAVLTHGAFAEAAVVGMPDALLGERICLFAIAKQDFLLPTVAELGSYLETFGLAKFKWPERIEVVESFPVGKSGKPDKGLMRQAIAAKIQIESKA